MNIRYKPLIAGGLLVVIILIAAILNNRSAAAPVRFDGDQAFKDAEFQMSLGPRILGSQAHERVITWMRAELDRAGWENYIQQDTISGLEVQNVVAKRGTGKPWIILGAHYDSRQFADQDPDLNNRTKAVPGANDGASGVAVLLELARTLPKNISKQVWLLFIDTEDQGDIHGQPWAVGAQSFAQQLQSKPDAVIIVDMIGDKDLNIYLERNSDPTLSNSIWDTAKNLGYDKQFIAQPKYRMEDDHIPFIQMGITAIDIIDFDYPYWHTTADTLDKISAGSLQAVGETLQQWIMAQ